MPLILMLLAAAMGMRIRQDLREHHKSVETTDLLRVTVTMLVTFAAIVLGLLITSSKTSFDAANNAVTELCLDIEAILMTRVAREAGPAPASPIRQDLAQYTAAAIASTWLESAAAAREIIIRAMLVTRIMASPMKARKLGSQIARHRRRRDFAIFQAQSAMQAPNQKSLRGGDGGGGAAALDNDRGVAGFALHAVFHGAGILAVHCLSLPRLEHAAGTRLSVITISLSAIALASALFVVADLNGLYSGVFVISSAPMRGALALMLSGRPLTRRTKPCYAIGNITKCNRTVCPKRRTVGPRTPRDFSRFGFCEGKLHKAFMTL